jgi:acetyltransferase-like isoleucine patch superfamily enzyme
MVKEIIQRMRYFAAADRIGPDIPTTHWKLHFKSLMNKTCQKKFGAFGEGAEFRPGAYAVFCSQIFIGKRVVIRPNSMLFADPDARIKIEDDVSMGSGVHIYVSNHSLINPDIPIMDQGYCDYAEVILRRGCWIGANAIILPGVEIGENSAIGAGSVVTNSIPSGVVAAGNPVRVIRKIESVQENYI